jgi:asparagine synthase (glutamine-hydrolysing)
MTVFPDDYKNNLYAPAVKEKLKGIDSIDFLIDAYGKVKASDLVEKIIGGDIITYLPDCLCVKMDIASSANSLESRSPFLDYKFMEFAASLPADFKLRGYTTKYILKKTLERYLPKEILYRRKMGFGVPLTHWFKGELKNYTYEVLLGKDAGRRGYFNREYVKQLLDEHTSGGVDHTTRIWALLNFEMWHRVFIDGK